MGVELTLEGGGRIICRTIGIVITQYAGGLAVMIRAYLLKKILPSFIEGVSQGVLLAAVGFVVLSFLG